MSVEPPSRAVLAPVVGPPRARVRVKVKVLQTLVATQMAPVPVRELAAAVVAVMQLRAAVKEKLSLRELGLERVDLQRAAAAKVRLMHKLKLAAVVELLKRAAPAGALVARLERAAVLVQQVAVVVAQQKQAETEGAVEKLHLMEAQPVGKDCSQLLEKVRALVVASKEAAVVAVVVEKPKAADHRSRSTEASQQELAKVSARAGVVGQATERARKAAAAEVAVDRAGVVPQVMVHVVVALAAEQELGAEKEIFKVEVAEETETRKVVARE